MHHQNLVEFKEGRKNLEQDPNLTKTHHPNEGTSDLLCFSPPLYLISK